MRRLLIRPGAIGDTIVSLPAMAALRAAETEIWAPTANLDLVAHLGSPCSLASTGLDLQIWPEQLVRRLRGFDDIVSWYGSAREDLRQRVQEFGLSFRFLSALPAENWSGHAVDFYLDQLGLPLGAVPVLPFRRAPGGYAVIHPFSGGRKKNWPLERFQAVAALLEKHMAVAWSAGEQEALEGAVRFERLGALAEWLAGASVYVGNDSGISHLAAACGVPVVAVFGPTDSIRWAPRGDAVLIADWDWAPERLAGAALTLARQLGPKTI